MSRDAELRDVLALLEKATPGEWKVRDENDGEGWPPRPLWCVENDAFHEDSDDGSPLQMVVHYGGKEDAELIAAAVNFLRKHGEALATGRDEDGVMAQDTREVRWYCVNNFGMATLCADESDARAVAADSDAAFPQSRPHAATQLAPLSPPAPSAEVAALVDEVDRIAGFLVGYGDAAEFAARQLRAALAPFNRPTGQKSDPTP
jgi:hypothetical protein